MERYATGLLLVCFVAFCCYPMADALYSIPFLTLRRPNNVRSPWTWNPVRKGNTAVGTTSETNSSHVWISNKSDHSPIPNRICAVLFERMNHQGTEQAVYSTNQHDRKNFSPFQSAIVHPGCRLSTCMRRPTNGHCFFFSETRSHSSAKMYPSYFLKCVCS